jgi:hypothetical protein
MAAGVVCLVTFAGKPFPVLRGFLNQGKRVGDKSIMPSTA